MKFNTIVNNILREMDEHIIWDIGPGEDPGPDGYTKRERLMDEIYYLRDEIRKLSGFKDTKNLSDIPTVSLEKMVNSLKRDLRMYQNRENERPY